MSAITFEAIKYAMRQSKDGVILSLVVHPNDVSTDLLAASIGAQFNVCLVPCDDTGELPQVETPPPAADAKPKERWHEMKRAKQAGIACDDPRFREWCGDTFVGPHTTADHVRARCGVASRADLDTDQEAGRRWDDLYDRYLRETGQQTERRG